MFATYIHDLDPVIFPIYGEIKLRWYGLAYLLGFIGGYVLLRYLAKRRLWVLEEDKVGDFIAYCAMFGVFLGGRLGYVLLYHVPVYGWGWVKENPLLPLKVMEGGMASHGGILGLALFTLWYAWKNKVSWFGVGDGLCVVAPIGILFGRIANFINGELYGRIATDSILAMKFPATLRESNPESAVFMDAIYAAAEHLPELAPEIQKLEQLSMNAAENPSAYFQQQNDVFEAVIAASRENDVVLQRLGDFLEPRYPSQLFEGFLEGLVLFLILWFMRLKWPKLPHGVLTGTFFILYAVFRIFVENFREPDSVMVGILTTGQFLSLFMLLGGAVFILVGIMKRESVASVQK